MKRRKVILGGLFLTSLATNAIVGCNTQSANNQGASDSKVLTLVTSPDYPPYEFYDTSGGERKIVGFDIDIANYIAKELGYELRIQESNFENENFHEKETYLSEIKEISDRLNSLHTKLKRQTSALAAERNNLILVLTKFANYIEQIANGDSNIASTSGFTLYNRVFSQEKPSVIFNFEIIKGVKNNGIRIHFDAHGHNNRYLIQQTENPEYSDSWYTLKVSKNNMIRLEGIFDRPGKYLRIMVINSGGKSEWSDIFALLSPSKKVA